MEEPISCGLKSACRERVVSNEKSGSKKSSKKKSKKKKMFPYAGRVK